LIKKVGDNFQSETKYFPNQILGTYLDWSKKPRTYKRYLENKRIDLSFPKILTTLSFDETIKKRKSTRQFSEKSLNLDQLSFLLWVSTGIQRVEYSYDFRNTPSAGALYPIETYLFAKNVDSLDEGLYHYDIKSHGLEELKLGDFSSSLFKACLSQEMFFSAGVVFLWSGIFFRSKWKYGERGYRYIYLECGHIAQNLALSASNIGLASCQVGAFYDDEVNRIFNLNGEKESIIYLSVVGHPL
jgi:SagB-type dehydrogenase family enzyme